MRRVIIALAATIAGLLASATPSNAAPSATLTSPMADGGLVQKVQVYPRHYYRQHPYGAPPVVHAVPPVVHAMPPVVHVVPPVVHVVPPVVHVVPPPRPTSCGQYHYWNGQNCVDARYNRPYLGARP
jgi:hypothetical protein